MFWTFSYDGTFEGSSRKPPFMTTPYWTIAKRNGAANIYVSGPGNLCSNHPPPLLWAPGPDGSTNKRFVEKTRPRGAIIAGMQFAFETKGLSKYFPAVVAQRAASIALHEMSAWRLSPGRIFGACLARKGAGKKQH